MISKVGILHPGEMGSFMAHCVRNTLGQVYWCPEQRGTATRLRAEAQGMTELASLQQFCNECELIISVCPPHAAAELARSIISLGYKGMYVDANALAPATLIAMSKQMQAAGISFVDGGIIGVPAYTPATTWLYLSGADAAQVAACFAKGPLETRILGTEPGQASALKMCFAGWNKGKNALLTGILAAAEQMGVREVLEQQLDRYEPGFTVAATARLRGIARKSWRFGPEMEEIAATLKASGVPPEFFVAAAELYRRESAFKDMAQAPELADILAAVAGKPE